MGRRRAAIQLPQEATPAPRIIAAVAGEEAIGVASAAARTPRQSHENSLPVCIAVLGDGRTNRDMGDPPHRSLLVIVRVMKHLIDRVAEAGHATGATRPGL